MHRTWPGLDRYRWDDYSLSPAQERVRERAAGFLARACDEDRVRSARGVDRQLWRESLEVVALAPRGGVDVDLVDLVLVAQECGVALAPIPFTTSAAALRLLAWCESREADALASSITEGSCVVSLRLASGSDPRLLLPPGQAPDVVLEWTDGSVRARRDREVVRLTTGTDARAAFGRAVAECTVLRAAELIGLAAGAQALGVEYARARTVGGSVIGSLQAVAFALARAQTMISAAEGLVRKAAWFSEHEPLARPELVPMAQLHAARTASTAVETSVHVQGASGFADDSEVGLYLNRLLAARNATGGGHDQLRHLGDLLAAGWLARVPAAGGGRP